MSIKINNIHLILFYFSISYVQWSLHNPKDEIYNFEGIANVEEFIEIATEEDLYVILRPGPYICAEIDNVCHLKTDYCLCQNY